MAKAKTSTKGKLRGAAASTESFCGIKGGPAIRQFREGGKHVVSVRSRGGKVQTFRGTKAQADAAFVNAVVNAKG